MVMKRVVVGDASNRHDPNIGGVRGEVKGRLAVRLVVLFRDETSRGRHIESASGLTKRVTSPPRLSLAWESVRHSLFVSCFPTRGPSFGVRHPATAVSGYPLVRRLIAIARLFASFQTRRLWKSCIGR